MKKQILGLAAWLALCFAVAACGALASMDAGSFYGQLVQPGWAPPAGVFGPVWTVLYALMGIAAWLVWRCHDNAQRRLAIGLFLLQLACNALWSWLFFAWRLGGPALADIALMWLLIVATLAVFWRVRPLAGALLAPYLLWVSFAFALNLFLWRLNPQALGS